MKHNIARLLSNKENEQTLTDSKELKWAKNSSLCLLQHLRDTVAENVLARVEHTTTVREALHDCRHDITTNPEVRQWCECAAARVGMVGVFEHVFK